MGEIVGLYVAAKHGQALRSVAEMRLIDGIGVAEDRFGDAGAKPHGNVTLIEAEAVEACARDHGLEFGFDVPRRNVVTRGAALNHLVGREFRLGEAVLRGVELCEPCRHLEQVSGVTGIRESLIHRGGLRADVVAGGVVRPGDRLAAESQTA